MVLKGNKNKSITSENTIATDDVIDVLSLIPPDILNDTNDNNNMDRNNDVTHEIMRKRKELKSR